MTRLKHNEMIFFELIRVAIGRQEGLSRTLSAEEWQSLYSMTEKQALLGVCFAVVKLLESQHQKIPQQLYFQWLAVTAQIQEQNERMNQACVKLQAMLREQGFECCILKGQAVARYYPETIREFRQPGDIDVLVWKNGQSTAETKWQLVALAKAYNPDAAGSEHHVGMEWNGFEVELHYEPAYMCNPWTNRQFQRWAVGHRTSDIMDAKTDIIKPSAEFDTVFLLAHAFRHYLSEGLGMRQVMDYYFLCASLNNNEEMINDKCLRSLGLLKFAGAMMWVLGHVFKLEREKMIVAPDEKRGMLLLQHIMEGGNFGHHNNNTVASKHTHIGRFTNQLVHDLCMTRYYPQEALWGPISMIREFLRKRI